MRKSGLLLVLAAAATFAIGGDRAVAQETLKVAVPQRGLWDTGIVELGKRGGIFKKHGLDIEILYTQGGAEGQQAVIAGSMDITTAAGISTIISAYAKGAPVRVIGSEIVGSPDLYWYVPAESPIKTIADLNGKSVAYSVTGSSSHAALLELIQQHKLNAKPVATGGITSTLTQTMTGQVDVGWSAVPLGLDKMEEGKIRIVWRGQDVTALRGRTTRVNVTNLDTLEKRRGAIERFMQAYRETIDWMYSDPAALKHYADFSRLPESVVRHAREFIPKETILPGNIVGMDQIVADAVRLKFIPAPLTKQQAEDFVRIPASLK